MRTYGSSSATFPATSMTRTLVKDLSADLILVITHKSTASPQMLSYSRGRMRVQETGKGLEEKDKRYTPQPDHSQTV